MSGESIEKVVRISGYRIDETGIHDRYLFWRHFGFWQYATTAKIILDDKFIKLVFNFEGRKRPVKVDASNTFKSALKIGEVLEMALVHSPNLVLDSSAQSFLEDVLTYKELSLAFPDRDEPETRLAKARIHLNQGDAKAARKEVEPLLQGFDNSLEERARIVRLRSYFIEPDATLARVEYERIAKLEVATGEARRLWAGWMLYQEEEGAEDFALAALAECKSIENRLEVEEGLIGFLVRHRRYDEAIGRIDELLAMKDQLDSNHFDGLTQSRDEVEKLKTDKEYNRRMTFWRPLKGSLIGYGILALVALLLLWPSIQATPKLLADLGDLSELEERGEIAQTGEFSPNIRDMDLGFVQLSYVYSLRDDHSTFHSHYGAVILRRSAAEAILANTRAHPVTYLPDSPFTSSVYPINKDNYIGVLAKHSPSYFLALLILLFVAYSFAKDLYKRFKYRSELKDIEKSK